MPSPQHKPAEVTKPALSRDPRRKDAGGTVNSTVAVGLLVYSFDYYNSVCIYSSIATSTVSFST